MTRFALCARISLAIGIFAAAVPCFPATYRVPPDDVLIAKAGGIVRGTVESVASVADPDGGIHTDVTIAVARVLKGEILGSSIVVRQLGGRVDGRAEVYPGTGSFAPGENVLLMLDPLAGDAFRVTDFALGNFTVLMAPDGTEILRRDGLRESFVLDGSGGTLSGNASSAATPAVAPGSPSTFVDADRDAAAFESYVSAVVAGLSPTADYLRARDDSIRLSEFTLLGAFVCSNNPSRTCQTNADCINPGNCIHPARWIEFDSSTHVQYKDYAGGDAGANCAGDGCHPEVAAGVSKWSATTGTKIFLDYVGTDGAIGSTCLGALNNRISFNDPCNEITNLSGCTGVLALGGFSSSSASGGQPFCPAKNNPTFDKITSGKIMINNGVGGCLNSCDYTDMIAHESGHTLGAGHSNDPNALMYPTINSGQCGDVHADDLAFAQCSYPGCTPSTVTTVTPRFTSPIWKAIVVGTGFKKGDVVQFNSSGTSGLWESAPVTKRKTSKKLVAKDVALIWPAGETVMVRVLSLSGCESNTVSVSR